VGIYFCRIWTKGAQIMRIPKSIMLYLFSDLALYITYLETELKASDLENRSLRDKIEKFENDQLKLVDS
jgi:hypothetical protein